MELSVFCHLVQSPDVTSDLAGVDAPLQLRPAAGRLSRVHPEVLIRDPAADLLQSGLLLRPAPQLLLHLLDLNTTTKQQQQVRLVTSECRGLQYMKTQVATDSDLRAEGFLQTEPLMGHPTLLLCKLGVFIAPPLLLLSTARM